MTQFKPRSSYDYFFSITTELYSTVSQDNILERSCGGSLDVTCSDKLRKAREIRAKY